MLLQAVGIARLNVDKCEQELCLPLALITWRVRERNKNENIVQRIGVGRKYCTQGFSLIL